MTTELSTNSKLVERVAKRIEEDLTSLMTEDEIKALVDVAVQNVFFKKVPQFRNGYKDGEASIIEAHVKTLVEPMVKKAIEEHIKNNYDVYMAAVKEMINTDIENIMVRSFSNIFSSSLYAMQASVENNIKSIINR